MKECLNPYSNGICSRSIKQLKEALKDLESLNPYSNGKRDGYLYHRLIERCLNPYFNGICSRSKKFTFDVKKLRRS